MRVWFSFVFFGLLLGFVSFGQTKFVTAFLGGNYYMNESQMPFATAGVIYQDFISPKTVLRMQGNVSLVQSESRFYSWDLKQMFEYHFLKMFKVRKRFVYSPYIAAGIGMAYVPSYDLGYNLIIPFSLGVKFRLGKNSIIGIENNFNWNDTRSFMGKQGDITVPFYDLFGIYFSFVLSKPHYVCPTYL